MYNFKHKDIMSRNHWVIKKWIMSNITNKQKSNRHRVSTFQQQLMTWRTFIYYIDWALAAHVFAKSCFQACNLCWIISSKQINRWFTALLVKNKKLFLQNKSFIGDHTLSYINLLYRIIRAAYLLNTYYKVN